MKTYTIYSLAAFSVVPTTSAWANGVFVGPGHRLGTHVDNPMFPSEVLELRNSRQRVAMDSTISPIYEIQDTDQQIQISLDIPGVNPEDINVTVEDDGKVLTIAAQRKRAGDNGGSHTNSVSQSFALNPIVDIEKFSANLKNGVLIVTAPKDLARIEKNIRKIPVTTTAEGSKEIPSNAGAGALESNAPVAEQ